MPTYEYACDACGKSFELEQRITESPVKKCIKCGKQKARRMISGGTFLLKGGGWYADGYSGKGNAKSEASGSDKSSSDGKAESTESKSSSGAEKAGKAESKSEKKAASQSAASSD